MQSEQLRIDPENLAVAEQRYPALARISGS